MPNDLLMRVVVPSRLALIKRGEETLGYNPYLNVWHRLEPFVAEMLRWLRASRGRDSLARHLEQRFQWAPGEGTHKLLKAVEWCILRDLLYLDREPARLPSNTSPSSLLSVYWICTQACNLRCSYCYQDALKARPGELTTAEAEDLIDQVVETGAKNFIFTGGEPLARKDLLRLAAYAKRRGLRANLITNGSLIHADNAREIAHTFDNISVSLDHAVPDHHDRHRGKGSWKKALGAIDLLLAAEAKVDINSVLSRSGLADVSQLQDLRATRRIGVHRIVPRFPMGRGSTVSGDELTPEELIGLSDRLHQTAPRQSADKPYSFSESCKGRIRNHCGAGLSEVSVDPEGWVYPCRLLQYAELRGQNVRQTRLIDIVRSNASIREVRERTADRLPACKTCIIRYHCGGGCRGIHMSFTGKHEESHPTFCHYLRRSFEVDAWSTTGEVPPPRRT